MKNRAGLLLSLPVLFSVGQTALAAATEEEATRLEGVFQSYLGTEAGVVAVETDGDGYVVTLDVTPYAKKAAASGATFSMTPIELTLTDKGDGKWDVSEDGPLEFNFKSPDAVSANMKIESYQWEGVFDEKLGSFESATGEMKNGTITENITDPAQGNVDINATFKNVKLVQTAVANASGGVDVIAKYELEGLTETVNTKGDATAGKPPLNLVMTAATGTYNTSATGYKMKPLFNLLAFGVTHQSKDLVVKDQAALKAILSDVLPFFETVSGTGNFKTVSVATPIGPVGMDSFTFGADLKGIVKDGKLRESFMVSGLTLPPAIVPPWATKLVPKDMTFDFQGSGFDLATPAQAILAALDLAKDPPLPAGFENTLIPTLLPKGTADIGLNPTSISNDIYSISAEGTMTAGPANPIPSGKATVKAKGLDEVLKIVQAAPPEAGLNQGSAVIVVAKGMAKTDADGSLSWVIESAGDGKVLVNGIDPTKMQ